MDVLQNGDCILAAMPLPVSGRKSGPTPPVADRPAFAAKGAIPGALVALTVVGLLTVFGEPVMAWLSPPEVRAGDGSPSSGSQAPAPSGPPSSRAEAGDAGDSAHGRDR